MSRRERQFPKPEEHNHFMNSSRNKLRDLGKVLEVVDANENPEVLEIIRTGNVTSVKGLKSKLSKYRSRCLEKYLLPEAEYFSKLISKIPAPIPSFATKIREINTQIANIEESHELRLKEIAKAFREERQHLDKKFQNPEFLKSLAKPSKELLKMRSEAHRLLDTKHYDQAELLLNQMRELEKNETRKAQAHIQEMYEKEDDRITTDYMEKRLALMRTSRETIVSLHEQKRKLMLDFENNLGPQVEHNELESSSWYLETKAPRMLNRECDLAILHSCAGLGRLERSNFVL